MENLKSQAYIHLKYHGEKEVDKVDQEKKKKNNK